MNQSSIAQRNDETGGKIPEIFINMHCFPVHRRSISTISITKWQQGTEW